jgi:hydroxyacylglutathione hydrolase
MRVVAVPCLSDNYAYLVIDEATDLAAVVDPGEAAPIEAALARERVALGAIWATHHHPDHVGGVAELVAAHPGIEVVAFAADHDAGRIPAVTHAVADRDTVTLAGLRATIIHNPGHTLGAISYWLPTAHDGAGAVFTGDTLFAAGCGRMFEGTPPMMQGSLAALAALPATTRVYYGHEYPAATLAFAAAIEPANAAIRARTAAVAAARGRGEPTTPSVMADEHATNPFLRVADPVVIAAARTRDAAAGDPASVFAAIRSWKNEFRG